MHPAYPSRPSGVCRAASLALVLFSFVSFGVAAAEETAPPPPATAGAAGIETDTVETDTDSTDEVRAAAEARQRRAATAELAARLRSGEAVVVAGPERPRWRGAPIDLSLRDADLVEVLRSFAKLMDVNLVIDPRVKGTVTVELEQVPWDQALYVILKSQGLGMEIDGRVWSVAAR